MDKSSRAVEKGRSKVKEKVEQSSNSTLTVVYVEKEREREKKIELFSSYMEFLLISRNVGNNCVKMPDVQTV
jgi:hypothetical protein